MRGHSGQPRRKTTMQIVANELLRVSAEKGLRLTGRIDLADFIGGTFVDERGQKFEVGIKWEQEGEN